MQEALLQYNLLVLFSSIIQKTGATCEKTGIFKPLRIQLKCRSCFRQGCESGSESWKQGNRLIFWGSGSTLMKEIGSGSELRSESAEKEQEPEAIFFKIRRFRIFKLATTVGEKCKNNNNNIKPTTRAWYGVEWNKNFGMDYERCQNGMEWKISRML